MKYVLSTMWTIQKENKMNVQMAKTFKLCIGRKVTVAFQTGIPMPHTNGGQAVASLTGILKEVGVKEDDNFSQWTKACFVLERDNKERLYGALDSVVYFSDVTDVEEKPKQDMEKMKEVLNAIDA